MWLTIVEGTSHQVTGERAVKLISVYQTKKQLSNILLEKVNRVHHSKLS